MPTQATAAITTAAIYDLQTYRLVMQMKAPDPADPQAVREASAAATALAAKDSGNPIEAMFLMQATAAYNASIQCLQRAAEPDVFGVTEVRLLTTAKALAKHAGRMLREVERRRGGGVAVKPTRRGKAKPEE